MIEKLKGKKLLIIGGAFQHCKIVEAANKMGVLTYVVDYLPVEKSPAKKIADYHFEYNITEYDEIVEMCKQESIDGVLASHLDACQIPYQVICERLGFPCFGTKEQFHILTDKIAFLKCCVENGIDIIPQYVESDFDKIDNKIEYPVLVKPCDSRGSRGQSVCYDYQEVIDGIKKAKDESLSKRVVIEKYMEGKQDFSMTYFVVDGNPFLIRLCDRYNGNKLDCLDKLCQGCISPSKYSELYINTIDNNIKKFIKNIGIKNGPVFMQGFVDGKKIRMYDPGLRFPGGEYERLLEATTGVSLASSLVEFALTGRMKKPNELSNDIYMLNKNYAIQLDISLKPGTIKSINGLDEIRCLSNVKTVAQRYFVGDTIPNSHDIRQRLCEIAFTISKESNIQTCVDNIINLIHVYDTENNDMLASVLSGSTFI